LNALELDGAGDERGSERAARVGLVLGPLLALLLLLAPDLPLDGPQRRVAAITALTATWWITLALPVGATSLLPAMLFPLAGVLSAGSVAPLYMGDLVMLFIGAFVIALGLERWGVHRRIALWTIARVGTSRRRLVLGFMCAAAFLSLWINNTATTLLMLPIAVAVLERVDGPGQGRSPFGLALLLGVAYSASLGGVGTPVGTTPNQVFLGQFEQRFQHPDTPALSFGIWLLAWGPFVLLYLPLGWLLLTRVLHRVPAAGTAGAEVIRAERRAQGPMSRAQWTMAAVFVVTALLWVTRADLELGALRVPGWARLFYGERSAEWYADNKKYVSDATVATGMAIACFLIPVDRARRVFLMDWRTASRLPWDVLLLLGSGFCIAEAFKATGLDAALGRVLSPMFVGHSSWVVVGATALFMSFLTEFTSNTATTAVLLPVIAAAGVEAGLDPLLVMVPATIAASCAFMMPVATPPNAVVFGSRRVAVADMARAGLVMNFAVVLLLVLVFQLWVRRVWAIGDGLPVWAGGG
jgi:sodium-dependent dicarboxylate transporter 2/3/5